MRLPVAALTTVVAALPAVATALANLNKEERAATPKKKTIFHKDGFKGKQAESINNMLKHYHVYPNKRNKDESRLVAVEESAPKKEATLENKNLSARRTITKEAQAYPSSATEKEPIGSAAAAAETNKNKDRAEAQKERRRRARKERRDRRNDRRAATQKDEGQQAVAATAAVADTPDKERRGAMRQLQLEPRKPNPRPPPSEVPNKKGKPNRARRDLHDPTVLFSSGIDKRELKKSKKGSYDSGSFSGGSGSEDTCIVHMTNLTPRQEFSDIFVMTHSDKLYPRLFEYGDPAYDDLAALAQDGDTDELVWYYDSAYGDDSVYWVSEERGPIRPGESISFGIDASGSYDRLTLATSFIFSNDGFVAINGEEIYDGAEFWLWGIDAGVEANTQFCWTVQASGNQFPVQAECYDNADANMNDNSIFGVGYVHVHSGIHDLEGKGDAKDFLAFSCDDFNANNFAEYFYEIGFNDDLLLSLDDDRDFLDYLRDNDDLQRYPIVDFALDSSDFFAFCE
jgi:hypothetical protein